MKFRISMKAVLWTWLFFILMLVGLAYNAYDRLSPQAFVQLATEQIQKNIPNSQLAVGSVDYHFSVDFNIKLKQVTVVRDEVQIAKIGEFELKIPWWLLITHRGTAQVNIGQVEILLSSNDVKKMATIPPVDPAVGSSVKIDIEIPKYLADAQFTLRAKDVSLKNEDASRTYLQISKLLVREFGLEKNSAFEIKLPVWFEHNQQTYSSEIWLFGDLTPKKDRWTFNYTGDFRTKDIEAKISFDDVALEGSILLELPAFKIESQTSFMIDKEERGTSLFNLDQASWKLDLDFSSLPMEFLALFEQEILNNYLKKFEGDGQGKISLSQKFDQEELLLQGSLSFPGKFKHLDFAHEGSWYITFDNNLWLTRFEGDFIKFSRESLIAFQQARLMEVRESYELQDLSFNEAFRLIPSLGEASKSDIPQHKSFLLTNIKRDEQLFSGSLELTSNVAALNYSGEISGAGESVKFKLIHDVDYSIDAEMSKFKMVNDFNLIAPWISGEGVINLEFSGRDLNQFPQGTWKMIGKVEGEKLDGLALTYLKNIWSQFDMAPKKQELNLLVNAKKSQLRFVALDDKPATLDVFLNKKEESESTGTLTHAAKSRKKVTKKISLDFFKKDS